MIEDPLAGFVILDAGSFVTGPFAAMMLADLGATVTKVEAPLKGDPFRAYGRSVNGLGLSFANANRNKGSVAIDLTTAEGQGSFYRLLETADGLLTNWRPRLETKHGLTPELVRDRFPRLVWVRLSGYGSTGPDAELPTFDSIVQSRSGLASAQGDDAGPAIVRSWVVDKVTATFAAQAAMAGLLARERTGRGSVIDVAMLDSIAYFNGPDVLVPRTLVADSGPSLNRQLRAVRPLPTSDGWIVISPVGGRQIKAALAALERPEGWAQLRAETDQARFTERFFELACSVTPSRSTATWLDAFGRHDVPVSAVKDLDEHLADPQVRHNETYVEVDDPRLGRIRQVRYPCRIDGRRVGRWTPAPDLGDAPPTHDPLKRD